MTVVDHLVYAVADLDAAVVELERSLGVRPRYGGAHTGLGTHNALVSFGDHYLEIIAPDPGQPEPSTPRPFGIDDLDGGPRLVTFAVRPEVGGSLDLLVERARRAGFDPGDPVAMSRRRPDGVELHWRLTMPTGIGDGLVPFVIDWGDAEMPAHTAPGGVELVELRSSHPDPRTVNDARDAVGFAPRAVGGTRPALTATLRGPAGTVTL